MGLWKSPAREFRQDVTLDGVLHGKVVIVTGGGAGIGEATALFFSEQGAKVAVLDRNGDSARRTAERCQGLALQADMRDRTSLAAAVERTLSHYGRIDVLVNNAGIYPRQAFVDITEEQWDEMHDVNLKGTFRMCQLVAPHMIRQRAGKIINISSVTFFLGVRLLSHYVAAKGGVIGLTRVLAKELGEFNIHVNCITPGAIQTESEKFFVTEEQARAFVESQSLKRRLQPLDIARVCAFLASSWSDGMTGQTVNVDGGWVLY
ncbi:MAG: SDR family oxidoreductase [Bryobacteraceae bacterium]|nr:SDR family oxidoreductase [Bryobacteraceae bacterium]MDW8377942.1 SDR family NAD(P)-dependent oxidoreductase [Bryobacterales bacterium]